MFWEHSPLLDHLEEITVSFFHAHPLIGPMTLLFAEEGGVPLPIPGDVYISYVGYQIAKGVIPYHVAFYMLMAAILGGSSVLFLLSYRFGKKLVIKFGRFIHLNEPKLNYLEKQFRRFGPLVIIFGRHVPGFRIPITVFAGVSRVDYRTFILSEAISVVVWVFVFINVGQRLSGKTRLLFHNHYAFLLFLGIPIILTIITMMFAKFIPEDNSPPPAQIPKHL